MKPGDLRVFNRWMVTRDGIALEGKAFVLLGPIEEEPSFYKRWWVLLDGKRDVLDEHTLVRFTDEAR
jgi:hypothetical protein